MRAPHGASLAAPFMACPCRIITPGSGPIAACTYKKEGHCLNAEHAPPDDRHLPLHHTEPCSFPCGATAGGLCMHNAPLLFLLPRLLSQMFSPAALPIHMPMPVLEICCTRNFLALWSQGFDQSGVHVWAVEMHNWEVDKRTHLRAPVPLPALSYLRSTRGILHVGGSGGCQMDQQMEMEWAMHASSLLNVYKGGIATYVLGH